MASSQADELPPKRTCSRCRRGNLPVNMFASFESDQSEPVKNCVLCRIESSREKKLGRVKSDYGREERCAVMITAQVERLVKWRTSLVDRGFPEMSQWSFEKILNSVRESLPASRKIHEDSQKRFRNTSRLPDLESMLKLLEWNKDVFPMFNRQYMYYWEMGYNEKPAEGWEPQVDWEKGPYPTNYGEYPNNRAEAPRWLSGKRGHEDTESEPKANKKAKLAKGETSLCLEDGGPSTEQEDGSAEGPTDNDLSTIKGVPIRSKGKDSEG